MLNIKKLTLVTISITTISILGACNFSVEKHEEMSVEEVNDSTGTMLAGQEALKQSGLLKEPKSENEVLITINGEDKILSLSDDAKNQLERGVVSFGDNVTFSTYSIGGSKETIDTFK